MPLGERKKSKLLWCGREDLGRYESLANVDSCARTARLGCLHWSSVGNANAPDEEIMKWAKSEEHVLFTHDLDFGAILAATNAAGPSVIQLRTQDTLPQSIEQLVVCVLRTYQADLERGSLIIVDEGRSRVRILPLN